MDDCPYRELTETIIGAAIKVHRELGPGFLERIYENALRHELAKSGLAAEQQRLVTVWYDGVNVGDHRLDLVVEGKVLLELKAVESVDSRAVAQTISSLRAAGLELGLIINFNEKLLKNGIKRISVRDQKPPSVD
jgi:GxxExxY protein